MLSLRRTLGAALAVAVGIATLARPARAHFILQSPPSWMSQDSLGLPEKLGPCGDEGGGTATNIVTAYQSGQSITVTIQEVVFHPGHYRVALSVTDRSELPPEPAVTAGVDACGTATIMNPPVFPVLADDLFDHTAAFTTPQSATITLPSNITCSHCTLQIIEFMSDHALNNPGGCFYHHCADISLQTTPVDSGTPEPDGGTGGSAGTGGSGGGAGNAGSGGTSGAGGSSGSSSESGGCSVTASPSGGSSPATGFAPVALAALAALVAAARGTRKKR